MCTLHKSFCDQKMFAFLCLVFVFQAVGFPFLSEFSSRTALGVNQLLSFCTVTYSWPSINVSRFQFILILKTWLMASHKCHLRRAYIHRHLEISCLCGLSSVCLKKNMSHHIMFGSVDQVQVCLARSKLEKTRLPRRKSSVDWNGSRVGRCRGFCTGTGLLWDMMFQLFSQHISSYFQIYGPFHAVKG